MFDEQPDGDPHGECAAEIHRLTDLVRWAYSKLHHVNFTRQDDALKLDEMKLLLEHGAPGVPGTHPMRDGYAGSVLTSGKEGHALLVRYATREQADAAQLWLTDALAGFDGVIHLYVEDEHLRQSLLDELRAYGVLVKEVPSGT
jgi:hypothetical protein